MSTNLKSYLSSIRINLFGWKTNRKIVVIESDDWGSIRMPDNATLQVLAINNSRILNDSYAKYDTLESNDDLEALFAVLKSVTDKNGHPAVLTANSIVSNPDFEKIASSGFCEYYYEKFTETLKRYPGRDKVMELIGQGINDHIYKPQFHGREHVNITQWLKALQNRNMELLEAFRYNVFGINLSVGTGKRKNLMSALDYEDRSEIENQKEIVKDGLRLFNEIFGFSSTSFIATTYIWDPALEKELKSNGIKYIQGIPYQYIPNPGVPRYKKKFHYTGQCNGHGQVYLVRNVFFEPTLVPGLDVVGECLQRIELAFFWGKPAIIGSHRVNFIGSLDETNRTRNLKLLKQLLSEKFVL